MANITWRLKITFMHTRPRLSRRTHCERCTLCQTSIMCAYIQERNTFVHFPDQVDKPRLSKTVLITDYGSTASDSSFQCKAGNDIQNACWLLRLLLLPRLFFPLKCEYSGLWGDLSSGHFVKSLQFSSTPLLKQKAHLDRDGRDGNKGFFGQRGWWGGGSIWNILSQATETSIKIIFEKWIDPIKVNLHSDLAKWWKRLVHSDAAWARWRIAAGYFTLPHISFHIVFFFEQAFDPITQSLRNSC